MTLVDWNIIIPADLGAKVLFSALAHPPHNDVIDANLVGIEMPGGMFIDVEFIRSKKQYVVTLFRDDIDNPLEVADCTDVNAVILVVKELAESTRIRTVGASKGSCFP